MGCLRDYNGLKKAYRHGWRLVYVRMDNFKIIGGEFVEPKNMYAGEDICLMTLEDYRWMTAYDKDDLPFKAVVTTLGEWYDSTDFNKLLKLCNLRC